MNTIRQLVKDKLLDLEGISAEKTFYNKDVYTVKNIEQCKDLIPLVQLGFKHPKGKHSRLKNSNNLPASMIKYVLNHNNSDKVSVTRRRLSNDQYTQYVINHDQSGSGSP